MNDDEKVDCFHCKGPYDTNNQPLHRLWSSMETLEFDQTVWDMGVERASSTWDDFKTLV